MKVRKAGWRDKVGCLGWASLMLTVGLSDVGALDRPLLITPAEGQPEIAQVTLDQDESGRWSLFGDMQGILESHRHWVAIFDKPDYQNRKIGAAYYNAGPFEAGNNWATLRYINGRLRLYEVSDSHFGVAESLDPKTLAFEEGRRIPMAPRGERSDHPVILSDGTALYWQFGLSADGRHQLELHRVLTDGRHSFAVAIPSLLPPSQGVTHRPSDVRVFPSPGGQTLVFWRWLTFVDFPGQPPLQHQVWCWLHLDLDGQTLWYLSRSGEGMEPPAVSAIVDEENRALLAAGDTIELVDSDGSVIASYPRTAPDLSPTVGLLGPGRFYAAYIEDNGEIHRSTTRIFDVREPDAQWVLQIPDVLAAPRHAADGYLFLSGWDAGTTSSGFLRLRKPFLAGISAAEPEGAELVSVHSLFGQDDEQRGLDYNRRGTPAWVGWTSHQGRDSVRVVAHNGALNPVAYREFIIDTFDREYSWVQETVTASDSPYRKRDLGEHFINMLPRTETRYELTPLDFEVSPWLDQMHQPELTYWIDGRDFNVRFPTQEGFRYVLEESYDLVNWIDKLYVTGDGNDATYLFWLTEPFITRWLRIRTIRL